MEGESLDKTRESIERVCFAYTPTYQKPASKDWLVWFELLRSDDGTRQETSFNVIHQDKPASKRAKSNKTYILNQFVCKALMPIADFGIVSPPQGIDPVVITTPPAWLESFFELLAEDLDSINKVPTQLTQESMTATAERAYLAVTTPKTPPPPPPMVGFTLVKRI